MSKTRPLITIGADPEFFLENADGNLESAIDRIGGYKTAPRSLGRPGFFVQEDNVAVEFNIPPASQVEEFVGSIQWAVKEIENEVKTMGLRPVFMASVLFPSTELTDPRARAFGCDPDYNAWRGGAVNPKPHSDNVRLRSCGGHVHVGWPHGAPVDAIRLIQLMDLYLGVPSVLMDGDEDARDRRQIYGKAGAYRNTTYGAEYRSLSNFWLKKPEYMKWVFNQTNRAVDKALEFGKPRSSEIPQSMVDGKREDYYHFMEANDLCDEIQNCIDYGNPLLAQKLVAHHDLEVVV